MKRALLALALLTAAVLTTGCDDFERASFNTLSTSKAVLDTAQADYEARTIPKTACAKSIIEYGKAAQTLAVTGLQDYHNASAAKQDVASAQAMVVGELATLTTSVAQVRNLISNPAAACGGAA